MDAIPEALAASGAIEIARHLGTVEGGRVLDVGTGRGDFLATLRDHLDGFSMLVGIDLDRGKLERAKDRLMDGPISLLLMDGGRMAFDDGPFDTVCISHSLHHLERPGTVLREMVRVLRPGGVFILQEMFSDGRQTPSQLTDIQVHHWTSRVDTLLGTFHRNTYEREEIRTAVKTQGLEDVRFFETTHNIDCLTCDDRFDCLDPLNPKVVRSEIEDIEEDMSRLETCPDQTLAAALLQEGRGLMDRVRETGVSPASTMFAIGRKGWAEG